MTNSRCRLYYGDTGIPVDRDPTPEEEALARTLTFHGHEWAGAPYILQHSHDRGGEGHDHPVKDLVDQIDAGEAALIVADDAE